MHTVTKTYREQDSRRTGKNERTDENIQNSMTYLKVRSIRDNLIFTGIPEQKREDTEELLQDFFNENTNWIIQSHLSAFTGLENEGNSMSTRETS